MEKYVNESTIIKNQMYESFKDYIYCQKCRSLLIEPVMCANCQNYFCKKCVEKQTKICDCKEPMMKNVVGKKNFITNIKFKCIKECGAEISFDDINSHYKSNCIENKKNNSNTTVQKTKTKNEERTI